MPPHLRSPWLAAMSLVTGVSPCPGTQEQTLPRAVREKKYVYSPKHWFLIRFSFFLFSFVGVGEGAGRTGDFCFAHCHFLTGREPLLRNRVESEIRSLSFKKLWCPPWPCTMQAHMDPGSGLFPPTGPLQACVSGGSPTPMYRGGAFVGHRCLLSPLLIDENATRAPSEPYTNPHFSPGAATRGKTRGTFFNPHPLHSPVLSQ